MLRGTRRSVIAVVAVMMAACSNGQTTPDQPSETGSVPQSPSASSPSSAPPVASPDDTASASEPTSSEPTSPGTTGPVSQSPTATPTLTTGSPTAAPVDPLLGLDLQLVADGLEMPLDVAARPGDGALFVVERLGVIRQVTGGTVADEPFIDLRDMVESDSIEQGLLGIAFHPDYPQDPRVFLFHSLADNNNVLVSYEVSDDPSRLDPDTRKVLLTVDKEPDKVRHNGGNLEFGPEGNLFLSLGDAARASVNGQDPSTLPGTILRLDIDGGDPYAIPEGNPFADGGEGRPEVWAFGLRNPWRFDIDPESGLLYIADVGQSDVEEVNVVPLDEPGINYGWPRYEGTGDFYEDPPFSEVTWPVLEVAHNDEEGGCSITGGVVYRGDAIPEMQGHYYYSDWCNGWIRSFLHEDGEATEQQDWSQDLEAEMVSSFGVDGQGEVLVVDYAAGTLSRIVPVR